MRRRLALALTALLGGCAVGPNYVPAAPPPAAAGAFVEAAPAQAPLPPGWWRLYADPTLDALVDEALRNNTDVRAAAANVRRARYVLAEARAGRLPTTDASASYSHLREGSQNIGTAATTTGTGGTTATGGTTTTGTTTTAIPESFTSDFFSAGLNIAYEIDLFGRVSRSIEAARGDVAVAAAALDAARVAVAAETARSYGEACGYAAQAATARETVRLQARTLDLTERLNSGGRGTLRDVDQARALLEQANADLPSFEGERRAALDGLAVLTGRPPAALDPAIASCARPPVLAVPLPAGDGAALLARRPDVRQAERQLAADTARIGVATADLYPSITLLGSVSLGAAHPGDLGRSSSLSSSLGPLISWSFPIQSAARARVRQSRATADQSLARFDGAVLTALGETEQALARLDAEMRRNRALARANAAAADAARLSRLRFDYGADSFLELLDAERTRAQAAAALAASNTALVDREVDLFRALGGGWEQAPPVAERAAQR